MNEEELSELVLSRRAKLGRLASSGIEAFKSHFNRTHLVSDIVSAHSSVAPGEETGARVLVAGRVMTMRRHGKVTFTDLKDSSGRLQLYVSVDALDPERYERFLELDLGDIIGAAGEVFKTRRGELSIRVDEFELLTKSLRPLPEKWHGLRDTETRFRQRYADLIVNPDSKKTLLFRTGVVRALRAYLDERGFIEVETPMLQPIPGGATARPFVTHHQALDMDLYLRIAPELYLKRLVVGDFDRVYEVNRNFRNEGISVRHNPEFTMLEAYQAYADYRDMMDLMEGLVKHAAQAVLGRLSFEHQGLPLDLSGEWPRVPMLDAIKLLAGVELSFDRDVEELRALAEDNGVSTEPHFGKGKIADEVFEKLVQDKIREPAFITDYPTEISPLARQKADDPRFTERFELIIAGLEMGTAFSELTNPLEQRERFEDQLKLKAAGDEEAQALDEDFIRALEYGMPPTGGLGLGVDRLVMLLTNQSSIREVIAFPQLRPER